MIHITEHAVDRFCERVANLPRAEVIAKLTAHAPAVARAAEFGCHTVRAGEGYKLVLCGERVVTVLARHHINHDLLPPRAAIGAAR